jgi:hypothetical protein
MLQHYCSGSIRPRSLTSFEMTNRRFAVISSEARNLSQDEDLCPTKIEPLPKESLSLRNRERQLFSPCPQQSSSRAARFGAYRRYQRVAPVTDRLTNKHDRRIETGQAAGWTRPTRFTASATLSEPRATATGRAPVRAGSLCPRARWLCAIRWRTRRSCRRCRRRG